MFDHHTWLLLAHVHDSMAGHAAQLLNSNCTALPAQAYLMHHCHKERPTQAQLEVAAICHTFVQRLEQLHPGPQPLMAFMAQAVQPGSKVHHQLTYSDAGPPDFTLLVQETLLPPDAPVYGAAQASQPSTMHTPALLALLHGHGWSLPVLHRIHTSAAGHRHCPLRPFPSLQEIQSLQPLLQSGYLLPQTLQ